MWKNPWDHSLTTPLQIASINCHNLSNATTQDTTYNWPDPPKQNAGAKCLMADGISQSSLHIHNNY